MCIECRGDRVGCTAWSAFGGDGSDRIRFADLAYAADDFLPGDRLNVRLKSLRGRFLVDASVQE
jgi:hypothetical protein